MAATRPKLKVSERTEFGSRTSRRMRRDGLVPGVVYTGGGPARAFQADAHTLGRFIQEGHALFDLEIEGTGVVPVVVKEEQRHPVRGNIVHLDCQEVDLDQEIHAEVPIELSGGDSAPGVKEGGILEHVTREVTVEALPTAIPDLITVDVSEMAIGGIVSLSDVPAPEGVVFVADAPEEVTIATLNPPRIVEEEEPEVEEETEVVGEEEADAEGEAVSEGSDSGDEG